MSNSVRANLFLLLASLIWGSSYTFQREAMEYLSPFAFNALRFILGGIVLLPFVIKNYSKKIIKKEKVIKSYFLPSIVCGILLFFGITFQQYGLIYTDSGKTAFITSLYVVIVPFLYRFMGNKISIFFYFGILIAIIGFYFLCITSNFSINYGDFLVLIGTIFWSFQFLAIAHYVSKVGAFSLTCGQSLVCGFLSLAITLLVESYPNIKDIYAVLFHLIWCGVVAVAIAYLLQLSAQKHAKPISASIILQTESVFAVIFGYIFLNETITARMYLGIILILIGIFVSQLLPIFFKKKQLFSL